MIITINGCRGSLPYSRTPQEVHQVISKIISQVKSGSEINFEDVSIYQEACGVGSETTNVMIEDDERENFLLVDCGTGIKKASEILFKNYQKYPEINILITHFHWDHLMGINFFPQIFMGKVINFFSPLENLEEMITKQFSKPNFPIKLEWLQSDISFIVVPPREKVQISGFDVSFYKMDHPDPCWGPRIERNGKTYAHAIDTEGIRRTSEELGLDLPFYQGVDLLHFDAPYMEEEITNSRQGWGHSSVNRGLELVNNFGIKNISFGHYTPDVNYKKFLEIKAECKKAYEQMNFSHEFEIFFSFDGQIIKV